MTGCDVGAAVSRPHLVEEPASVFRESPKEGRQGEELEQLTLSSCPDMLPLSPDRKFHLAPCFWPSLLLISLLSIRIKMLRMSENFQMTFLTKPWPKKKSIYILYCVSAKYECICAWNTIRIGVGSQSWSQESTSSDTKPQEAPWPEPREVSMKNVHENLHNCAAWAQGQALML